jgi:uncharacterized protein (DUF433 family)
MFPLIAFPADMVSRLTGLSTRQLHRWDRSGFFVPSFADPDRRRRDNRFYSLGDALGLRTIAKLRERGVSFPELTKVREVFASGSTEDWANRRFYVVSKRVFLSEQDAAVAKESLGQRADCAVVDVASIVDEVAAAVRQLSVRTPDQIGRITSERQIMEGAPTIAGTRIPTATIDWFYRNGYDVDAILREFPRLTPADVAAAVEFEQTRRGDVPRRAQAAG